MFYGLQNNYGIPQSYLAGQESNYGTLFSQSHLIYSGALTDYPHREPDGRTDFAPVPGYNSLLNELNGRGSRPGSATSRTSRSTP